MTDEERFDVVLEELRGLMTALGDFAGSVVLIGGQVVALQQKQRVGNGSIDIQTSVGVVVSRGFSLDSDLLLAFDGTAHEQRGEEFPAILRSRGFTRSNPDTRWLKTVGDVAVPIDLFVTPDLALDAYPTRATVLYDGDLAASRPTRLEVPLRAGMLEIQVPNPLGYLALKVDAKLRRRPAQTKDSFDLFAFVQTMGADVAGGALRDSRAHGPRVADELKQLFCSPSAAGVQDVVTYSRTSLGPAERALLEQAAVDLFAEVLRVAVR